MDPSLTVGAVVGIFIAVVGEVLATRVVEPYLDRTQYWWLSRRRLHRLARLEHEMRLVAEFRADPSRLYRFALVHLFAALLALATCGMCLMLGTFLTIPRSPVGATVVTTAIATVPCAIGGVLFLHVAFHNLIEGLTMLRRVDSYDEWLAFAEAMKRKLDVAQSRQT